LNTAIHQVEDLYRRLEKTCSEMEKQLIDQRNTENGDNENGNGIIVPIQAEKPRKEFSAEELLDLLRVHGEIEIKTRFDLEQFIDRLKNQLFESLKNHTLVIKR
jgi:hypothetical protein